MGKYFTYGKQSDLNNILLAIFNGVILFAGI